MGDTRLGGNGIRDEGGKGGSVVQELSVGIEILDVG